MKKNKKSLILSIIVSIVLLLILTILIIVGSISYNDDLVVIGAFFLIILVLILLFDIISYVKKLKKSTANANTISQRDKKFLNQFYSVNENEFNEMNQVSFVNEGIKFSAKGKYGYVKDFNGIQGYHLGFNIEGLKLIEKPKDYEDIVNYEGLLFNIDLGYFEGSLLSQPENDNGIIVEDISNLEGKAIQIKENDGYIAGIQTAEEDQINIGEIKFIEWKENSKIIKFKLLVGYGLSDIVVGIVKLAEDKSNLKRD